MNIPKSTVVLLTLLFVFFYSSGNVTADEPHDTYPPLPEAYDAMESDDAVTVETVVVEEWEENSNFYYTFTPKNTDPTISFIIYPGALVDPIAYAPPAHAIAAEGFLTVIVKMKDDLYFGANKTNEIMSNHAGIEKWIVGGHSMGGTVACGYANKYTDKVEGIVLWASYPAYTDSLADKDVKVISIYGTKDGDVEGIEASAEQLPSDTQWVPVEGGNHTQCAWYDTSPDPIQPGDNPADITREEQQEQMIQATVGFLESFVTTTTTSIQSSSTTTTTITGSSCPSTRIYGEYSREVELLRYFRDNMLSKTPEGRELIRLYYDWSPAITEVMDKDEALKEDLKELSDGILGLINEEVNYHP
jgi:hypothetical protein